MTNRGRRSAWRSGWRSRCALALLACGAAFGAWPQTDALLAGAFSAFKPGAAIPAEWKAVGPARESKQTRYTLVADGATTVIRTDSSATASGLSRRLRVDPGAYPVLRWRWKVANILKASDITSKQGDDFPARLYVMFDYPLEKLPFGERVKIRLARALYDPDLPAATLCYVWDGKAPAGTIVPSPYTSRVRTIVVESGASRVNQWLSVEREIAEDFRAAFGETAPAITALAIATDTDNTGESATAFFGDILFYKQKLIN
jgi:hypothetical protein